MRLLQYGALIAVSMLTFLSCNSTNEKADSVSKKETEANVAVTELKQFSPPEAEQDTPTDFEKEYQENEQQPPGAKQPSRTVTHVEAQDWSRKIIKTAEINVEVKDHQLFYNLLNQKVKNLGGYISSEEQNQDDYRIQNHLVIKVPVTQFDNAISGIDKDVLSVVQRKISSQDVTAEVIDTRSRMMAKKKVRQRYTELLGMAKTMEDVFTVEKEINSIQEDIEAADGRLNYLGHASAYSTINFTYFQVLNAAAKKSDDPGFVTQLKNALSTGMSWVSWLLLSAIAVWPLWLFILLGYWIFKRKFKRLKVS
ncbi:DUF4349 domain-containing protein [Terrimonas sp. NA20]|uniref:DUF4349 domain-containing protein n=1 Tax=Terrimonas ginsenosidimutans TaxID=2908004 RepID=A0ABS9KMT7_9BACT|nr:DUF4349 domain-containing protein [Terrimonas ginsenosidimutans]MCG2613605.1 DUF4349 domain-containing protein [Terrimonas ginsenosidimutans]